MDRVRGAGQAVLLLLVLASLALVGPRSLAARPPAEFAASVAWPTSTLVVSEVQTGGASASDEFAEISNAGAVAIDLTGLEVVYATSTGSTVTRKASWTAATILEPGRHLLIANSAGVSRPIADATYSGGFAATGGAILLQPIGGTPIDAVGGRRDERVRRGRGTCAARRIEHRAVAGRRARQRDRHERELAGLRGPDVADATEPAASPTPPSPTPPDADGGPTPPPRRLRPTPAPTPTPTPTPIT
jgi:hypothetical protein